MGDYGLVVKTIINDFVQPDDLAKVKYATLETTLNSFQLGRVESVTLQVPVGGRAYKSGGGEDELTHLISYTPPASVVEETNSFVARGPGAKALLEALAVFYQAFDGQFDVEEVRPIPSQHKKQNNRQHQATH